MARRTLPRGFTLVELLMVLLVISILASIVLGALASARESGRTAQTKATISKLHQQIIQHWEGYRTRRVPVYAVALPNGLPEPARAFAARQLQVRWDLMRAELPDRYEDILYVPDYASWPYYNSGTPLTYTQNAIFNGSLPRVYRSVAGLPNATRLGQIRRDNESAECLYMIITFGLGGGSEVKMFDFEVADTDMDGMPEFIDAWGRPIHFIRWPAGYDPWLGDVTRGGNLRDAVITDLQSMEPVNRSPNVPYVPLRPNAFDPLGVGRPGSQGFVLAPPAVFNEAYAGNRPAFGWDLVPLIASAGPDGAHGLYGLVLPTSLNPQLYRNPYSVFGVQGGRRLLRGMPTTYQFQGPNPEGGGHLDNITNHQVGTR